MFGAKARAEIAALPTFPNVEELVEMKLAGVMQKRAVKEARIIEAMQEDLMPEGIPDGYSSDLWAIEQNQNAVNRKFKSPIGG